MIEGGTLGYIFACLFLLLSLVYYTLYSSMFIAKLITYVVNKFFLNSQQQFSLGSIAFSPLRSRLMLKNIHYFDSNIGLRVCDMYVTFKYWGRLSKESGWRTPNISEKLSKGTLVRFRRRKEVEFSHGIVISDILTEEKLKIKITDGTKENEIERVRRRSIQVRSSPGRIKVHLNGLEVFTYNNYNAYRALKPFIEHQEFSGEEFLQRAHSSDPSGPIERTNESKILREPLIKKRRISSFEKFMNFIRQVEFDVRTACISIGSTSENTPYFLHSTFSECFGSYFLSGGDFLGEDLYRQIADMFIYSLGIRFVPVEKLLSIDMPEMPQRSTFAAARFKKLKSNFLDAANLVISGDHSLVEENEDLSERERSVSDTVVVGPGDAASVHLTWYKDEAGVYLNSRKRENIHTLPRIGLLLEVDSKGISYGPFAEITRKMIIEHFFPPNYQSSQKHEITVAQQRPHGLFEVRVDFVSDCILTVPFGLKADSPSPPFGTQDSGEIGQLELHLDAGSQVITKIPLVFQAEVDRNVMETYIQILNARIFTSMNKSLLLESPSLNLHIDSHIPCAFDAQRLLDISIVLHGGQIWYLTDHLRFIQDLLTDLSHGKITYHSANIDSSWSYAYFFSDFVPQTAQFEVFFAEPTKIYLNVNENNIIYAKNHCSMEDNNFIVACFSNGDIRLCTDYHGYTVFRENEQKTHFDVNLTDFTLTFAPSQHHELVPEAYAFAEARLLRLHGYFSVMLPNMSQSLVEFEKQQTQTNASTGPAKFANVLKLSVHFNELAGDLKPHHIQILHILQRNYIGEESRHVLPTEYPYFQHDGKNIKSCMNRFLTRNDPRRNDLECIVDVVICKYVIELSLGNVLQSSSLPVVLRGDDFFFSLRSSVKIDEYQVCTSPIEVALKDQEFDKASAHRAFCMIQSIHISYTQLLSAYPMQLPYQSTVRFEVGDVTLKATPLHILCIHKHLQNTRWVFRDAQVADIQSKLQTKSNSKRKLENTLFHMKHGMVNKAAGLGQVQVPLLNPYEDPSIINHFQEWYSQKAEKVSEAHTLCYLLFQGSVRHLTISCPITEATLQAIVAFPRGIHVGYTSLHDGNSDSRWSLCAPNIDARLLHRKTNLKGEVGHHWVEALILDTAIFLRSSKSISLNSDSGLNQFTKQRTFMAANHMYYDFNKASESSPSALFEPSVRSVVTHRHPKKHNVKESIRKTSSKKKSSDQEVSKYRSGVTDGHFESRNETKVWKSVPLSIGTSESLGQVQYMRCSPYVQFEDPRNHPNPMSENDSGHKFLISALVPNNEHRGRNNISTVCYSLNFSRTFSIRIGADLPKCILETIDAIQKSYHCMPMSTDIVSDGYTGPVNTEEHTKDSSKPGNKELKPNRTNFILCLNAPTVDIRIFIRNEPSSPSPEYHHKFFAKNFHAVLSTERGNQSEALHGKKFSTSVTFSEFEMKFIELSQKKVNVTQAKEMADHQAKHTEENNVFSVKCSDFQLRAKVRQRQNKSPLFAKYAPVAVTTGDITCVLTERTAVALLELSRSMEDICVYFGQNTDGSKEGLSVETNTMNLDLRTHLKKVDFTYRQTQVHGVKQSHISSLVIDNTDLHFLHHEKQNAAVCLVNVNALQMRVSPEICGLLQSARALFHGSTEQASTPFGFRFQSRIQTCNIKLKSKQGDYIKLFASDLVFISSRCVIGGDENGVSTLVENIGTAEKLEIYYVITESSCVNVESRYDMRTAQVLKCTATNLVSSIIPSAESALSTTVEWASFDLEMPYRHDMMENVIPMFREFIHSWKAAVQNTLSASSFPIDSKGEKATILHCDLREISFQARLANHTEVTFSIQNLSLVHSSALEGVRLRVFASAISVSTADTVFGLPNMYYFQTQESLRLTKRNIFVIDSWKALVTNEIFSNCLEMFRRFGVDLIEFLTPLLIQGSANIVQAIDRAEMWKFFFAGLDISIQAAFATLSIKMGEFNIGFLRSAEPRFFRWLFAVPVVRVTLVDQICIEKHRHEEYETLDADESSSDEDLKMSSQPNGIEYSSSENGSKKTRDMSGHAQDSDIAHMAKSQFIWLQTTTALHGSNFDEASLESGSAFDQHVGPADFVSSGAGSHIDDGTQILHARFDIPAIQTLLRPGSLKVLIEFVNEYEAKWTDIEKEFQDEKEITSERLKENPLYKGAQVSTMHIVHSLMTTLSGQSDSEDVHLEREWLLITSVFISRISFVIAFGDDLYNRTRSRALRYVCEHKSPRHHTAACLNEDFLYPLFTAKIYIDTLKLVDSVQLIGNRTGEFFTRIFSIDGKMAYFYIRDESLSESTQSFDALLHSKNANEFFGAAKGAEFSKASNRAHVPSFAVKGKTIARKQTKETIISMSSDGPMIHFNMRLFFYMQDIQKEFTPMVSFSKSKSSEPKQQKVRTTSYSFDVAPGELHVTSCVSLPKYFSSPAEIRKARSVFARPVSVNAPRQDESTVSDNSSDRSVLDIATPSFNGTLRRMTDNKGCLRYTSHVNVLLSQIKVNPAVVILMTEYDYLESRWDDEKQKKNVTLNSKQKSDKLVHMLSFPHALLLHSLAESDQLSSTAPKMHSPPIDKGFADSLSGTVHFSVMPFKLIVSTDPFTSTSMIISIEDHGSLDILFSQKAGTTCTEVVCKKIHAEVQSRMEIKSIEVYVPLMTADVVSAYKHTVLHVNLHEDHKDGMDLMYRLTHISQWYVLTDLWRTKLEQARKLSVDLCNRDTHTLGSRKHSLTEELGNLERYLDVIVNVHKITSSFVIGKTSKYDITLGRTSLFYSTKYSGGRNFIEALLQEDVATKVNFVLTDFNVFCEGHATGCAFSDKTVYLQLKVCDPVECHVSETFRQAKVVIPHFHAALRERQLSEAVQLDLVNVVLLFEDEMTVDIEAQYSIFLECNVNRASVYLSTALVSMVKSIQAEAQTTVSTQYQAARKLIDSMNVHHVWSTQKKTPVIHKSRFIPFMGNMLCTPPNGQIMLSIKDLALTVGEAAPSQTVNVLLLSMERFLAEFAETRDLDKIQKACCLDVYNWNISRTAEDQRSLIIGSLGQNSLHLETTQKIAAENVAFCFGSQFDQPWHGSPQLADFELIARIVKTFSELSSQSIDGSYAQDLRKYTAIDPGTFAPELRVTSDTVVNIDTLLSWAGMRQDTLPKHMHTLVTDLLENLLHAIYSAICPHDILAREKTSVGDLLDRQNTGKHQSHPGL